MTDYFTLLEYKNELTERSGLADRLSKIAFHYLVVRKSADGIRYAERITDCGVIREKTLSAEDYNYLSRVNSEYHCIRKAIKYLDKSIDKLRLQVGKCYKNVSDDYERLCLLAKNNNYYRRDNNYMTDSLINRTLRGDYVRSKSEVFIADVLYMNKINYIYEYSETEAGMHPDFYIPDNIRGVPVIWEHFGKLDSPSYVNSCILKLGTYKKSGFLLNRNLIITCESYAQNGRMVFDSNQAEQIVREWFLPEGIACWDR